VITLVHTFFVLRANIRWTRHKSRQVIKIVGLQHDFDKVIFTAVTVMVTDNRPTIYMQSVNNSALEYIVEHCAAAATK